MLKNKVLTWLKANPDKTIDADTIADFFSVPRSKVITELAAAVKAHEIGFNPKGGEDEEPIWYLPNKSVLAAAPTAASKPTNSSPFTRQRYTRRDFSEIEIENDVPIDTPAPRQPAQYMQLLELFKRMKKGQSVKLDACNAIRHASAIFNKQKGQRVVSRKVDERTTRVWRTE